MKKIFLGCTLLAGLFLGSMEVHGAETTSMYRMYNPNSGEHFYTKDSNEKNQLWSVGWQYEGVGWNAPLSGWVPVFRLYNPNVGDHHYTRNKYEKDNLIANGWRDEGIGWYSEENETVPLYRSYNPNAKTGSHHYTVLKAEHDSLIRAGWRDEGISWYGGNLDSSQLTAEKVYESLTGDFLTDPGVDIIGGEGRWLTRIRPNRVTADPYQTGLPGYSRKIVSRSWDAVQKELKVVVEMSSQMTGEYHFDEHYTFYDIDLEHFSKFSLTYDSQIDYIDAVYYRIPSWNY